MSNAVVDTYRKYLAQSNQRDDRDDSFITADLGAWAEQNKPELFQQFPDFANDWGQIREANAPSLAGEFGTAFKSGAQGLASTALGGAALVTGSDYLKDKARSFDEDAAANAPTIPALENIDPGEPSVLRRAMSRDALRYGVSKFGSVAPSIAESVATATAGAAIGSAMAPGAGTIAGAAEGVMEKGLVKAAIRSLLAKGEAQTAANVAKEAAAIGAVRGGNIANAAGSFLLNSGDVASEGADRPTTLALGAISAIPDTILPAYVLHKFFPGVAKKAAVDAGKSFLARNALKIAEAVGVPAEEFGQEYFQEAVNVVARNMKDGKDPLDFNDADLKRFREAGIAGAAGGILAAPGVMLSGREGAAPETTAGATLRQQMASRALEPQQTARTVGAPILPTAPVAVESTDEVPATPSVPLARQVVLMRDDTQKQTVFDQLTAKIASGATLTADEANALSILAADGFEPPAKLSEPPSALPTPPEVTPTLPESPASPPLPAATATVEPQPGLILPAETLPPVAAGQSPSLVSAENAPTDTTAETQPRFLAPAPVGPTPAESPAAAPDAPITYQYSVFGPEVLTPDGKRYAQIDIVQNGDSIGSTNIEALKQKGVVLPEPPVWMPMGKFTPEQVQEAILSGPTAAPVSSPSPEVSPIAAPTEQPTAAAPVAAPDPNAALETNLRAALESKPEPFAFGPVAEGAENVVDYRAKPEFANLQPAQWEAALAELRGLREGEKPNIAKTRTALVLRGPDGTIVQAGLLPPSTAKSVGGETATGFRLQQMGTQSGVGKGPVRVRINPGGKTTVLLRDVLAAGYTPVARLTFREEPGKIFQSFANEAAYNASAQLSGVAPVPEAVSVTPQQRLAEIDQQAAQLEESALQVDPTERARIEQQMEALAGEYRQLGGEPKFMSVMAEPPASIQANQTEALARATARLRQMGAKVDVFTRGFFQANLVQHLQRRLDALIRMYPITPEEEQAELQSAIENVQRQIASAERVRGVTYNANHVALGLSDVQNASIADLVVLLHEAGHMLLARSGTKTQGAVLRAVDSAFAEIEGKLKTSQGKSGVTEVINGDPEELIVSSIAQKLALEGIPESPSLARSLWQWVKDLYFRVAMGVQAAFGREPNAQLATDWFENQVRRAVGGDYDYRFSSLLDRLAPETMAAQVARVAPMEGALNSMTDRYDPMTESVRQPEALDNTGDGVAWNSKFMTEVGPNPGEEQDIPHTEAMARIRAAAINEEAQLAEKAYADLMASIPDGGEKMTFDQWWTLVSGSRETPKARLDMLAQKLPGVETATVGSEQMTDAMNKQALVRAKALVKSWNNAVARKVATALESTAAAETGLTDTAKLINKIEADLRNAAMHEATLTQKLNELVDAMRKGLRRGRDAVKVGPLAAAIRKVEGLGERDAIPDEYLRVFKAVKDGEVRIFDYLQAIAKMDSPLADMTVTEVMDAIRAEAPGDATLARLVEPRNKPLFVALATLAQRNADQMDMIQLRLADAKTYLAIKPELDAIRRASEAELGQIEKSFKEGTKATVYADRIKQRMVEQRRKLRRFQSTIQTAEERREMMAKLQPALSAKLTEIETNGLPQPSEWRASNGAVYPAMYQDEAGKWRKRDRMLTFATDGSATAPEQISEDLASNRQYLEANRERAGSQIYQLVQRATDEIGAIDAQQKHFEIRRNWYEKWFLPAADQLVSGGGAGAARVREMLNRFQFILFKNWASEIEVPAVKWTAAAQAATKAAGMKDQRAFLDQVYDPVIYHLGVNPGLEEGPALREAVRAARRRLTTEPAENFDEALKNLMRQTKAMSDTFVKIAEDNGVFVEDDKLGGELRRAVARGWLTVMRSMDAGTVSTVLRDMDRSGWKLEFQDAKTGAKTESNFDQGAKQGSRVVAGTTFDALMPWLTGDEQEAEARKAVLESPESFKQAISGFFTPGVVQRFLEPFINKPGEPIFGYRGEDIDQLDVQQAWQDAGGDVAKWIDLLGQRVGLSEETVNLDGEEVPQIELDSDLSPEAEWRTIMLRRIDALYKMTAGMAADANHTKNLFDPSGRPPLVLMTDRDNDLLPAEFVQHATFGKDEAHSLLATLAFHAAFGRNGESMTRAINEMKSNLEARKQQFDMLASRSSTTKGRKDLAKAMGIDYAEAKRAAAIYKDVENGMDVLKAQFGLGNSAGVMGDVRGGLAAMHFLASQITNQPKTGLLNMLQPAQRAIARRSMGPVMARDTARAFGGTAHTLLGQMLESFGLHLLHSSQHAKDIGSYQGQGFGQLSNAELLGLGIGRRGDQRNPVARAAATLQGFQRRGGFGSPKEFPRAANVPVATNIMHSLGLDVAIANGTAEARSVEGLIKGAMDYFAAHPEDATNPTFRLSNKNIGGAWGFDASSFDYMRRKLAENNFGSLESLVKRATERQARGEPLLTKNEVAKIAMLSNNDLDLMGNINTRPGWWAQNPVMKLFTPLLGWPIAQMNSVHQAMRTAEGRASMTQALKTLGILAGWSLPVGLAFTFLTDYYDDKVLKKKSNLGNVSPFAAIPGIGPALALATSDLDPMQQLSSMGQRLSRAGNIYGLGADFASSVLTGMDDTSGQRPFSLDSRILAFSQLMNLKQVMTNWINSGFATTYANIERPLIQALGGNGALQALDTFNNALGLDNQEARIVARTNAQQWLRVAAREAGVELRKSGGASVAPTPVSAWVREMQLAAMGGDRMDFLAAYQRALEAAREQGDADPGKKVLESWRSRNPLDVLRLKPDAAQMQRMYGAMDDSGREAVQSALRLYDQFTAMIAPTPVERWQTRQQAAQKALLTRGMNLRQQMSGAALMGR